MDLLLQALTQTEDEEALAQTMEQLSQVKDDLTEAGLALYEQMTQEE